MTDRTANWGDPAEAGTTYQTGDDDPAGGGNFVVTRDVNQDLVLLQWNPIAEQWEFAGPVDLADNDLITSGTVQAGALEAGNAEINNWPVEDNRELIGFVADNDETTPLSETIAEVPTWDIRGGPYQYLIIEILVWEDCDGTQENLYLTIGGLNDGDYDYILHDQDGSFDTRVTGGNEFVLIDNDSTQTFSRYSAEFKLSCGAVNRLSLSRRDFNTIRVASGKVLFNSTTSGEGADDSADFNFQSDNNSRLAAAIWRVQPRENI